MDYIDQKHGLYKMTYKNKFHVYTFEAFMGYAINQQEIYLQLLYA